MSSFQSPEEYYNYVYNAVRYGTPEELAQIRQQSFQYGEAGVNARALIDKEIYNIADRFNLIKNRLSLEDLVRLHEEALFSEQLQRGDSRTLLNQISKSPTPHLVNLLIKAVKEFRVQTPRDLAKIAYIIAQNRGMREAPLLRQIFLRPEVFLAGNGTAQHKAEVLDAVVQFMQNLRDISVMRVFKTVLAPGDWEAVIDAFDYDPVAYHDKMVEERRQAGMSDMEIEESVTRTVPTSSSAAARSSTTTTTTSTTKSASAAKPTTVSPPAKSNGSTTTTTKPLSSARTSRYRDYEEDEATVSGENDYGNDYESEESG